MILVIQNTRISDCVLCCVTCSYTNKKLELHKKIFAFDILIPAMILVNNSIMNILWSIVVCVLFLILNYLLCFLFCLTSGSLCKISLSYTCNPSSILCLSRWVVNIMVVALMWEMNFFPQDTTAYHVEIKGNYLSVEEKKEN